MKTQILNTLAAGVVMLVSVLSAAQIANAQTAGDTVLVSNSFAKVTRAELDVELQRLPAELRPGFANNARRVNDLLVRMLVQKSLAAQARSAKLDAQPDNMLRIQLEADRMLGQIYIEKVEADAAATFEATKSRFEARAREIYIIDKARFARPEQLEATHILFDTKKRSADDARKLAIATRARIAAGADMGTLARELSDDPSGQINNGKLDWFASKEMDPAFAATAFALKNVGDLSEPVQSQFGWHVIRLEARRPATVPPYDEVRDTILAELKKRLVDERREEAIAVVRKDPQTQVNREAVDALTPRVDVEAVKRAAGAAAGAQAPAPKPAPQ